MTEPNSPPGGTAPLPASKITSPLPLAAVTFVASLLLFVACAGLTVTRGGDCGELIAASWTLGIAHPSGYSLYMLLGRLFATLVPWGEVAWRYNLFSAVTGAGTCALVALIVWTLLRKDSPRRAWGAGLGAGLLLAGMSYFGTQAIVAEIYSLNGFLLASLLYCALRWHESEDWRWFYALCLTTGYALTLHLSCVFMLPGLFYMAVWKHRTRFLTGTKRRLRLATPLLLLGLALCTMAYLPLRSSLFPVAAGQTNISRPVHWPLDWGHPANPQAFKKHVTAQQYKHLLTTRVPVTLAGRLFEVPAPARPWKEWPAALGRWSSFLALQLLWMVLLLPLGAVVAWRDRGLGICLLSAAVLNAGQFAYKVNDLANFFFPMYVVFGVWMGLGLAAVARRASRFSPAARWRLRTGGVMLLGTSICLQWTIFALFNSYRGKDLAAQVGLRQADLAEKLSAESGQPVYAFMQANDSLWIFWYVQYVLGRAPETVTPWGKAFKGPEQEKLLTRYVAQLLPRGPVVFTQFHPEVNKKFAFQALDDSGSLWRVSGRSMPPPGTLARETWPGVGLGELGARLPQSKLFPRRGGHRTLLRGTTVPLEVKFQTRLSATQDFWDNWKPRPDFVAGQVEVLLRSLKDDGPLPAPPEPGQSTDREGDEVDGLVRVSHQTRPLIANGKYKDNPPLVTRVPLDIPDQLHPGKCQIWTRFSYGKWNLMETVRVSVK